MKSLFVSAFLAGVAGLWLSGSAQADSPDPGINVRQHRQQHRIGQGVRTGELTAAEARRLEREQRHIRQEERLYKSDGVLTQAERADLQRDLNRSSRHIYNEKHD